MAIVKRPAGEAETYGQAGKAVGEAKRSAQARQEGARIAAEDRARQWNIEKMLYNSQQEFLHEQRMRQVELDKEARSHEWELEKAEMNSRIQFELENKRYIRDYEKYQSGLDEISKIRAEGNYPDSVIQRMEYTLNREYANKIPEAATKLGLYLPPTTQDQLKRTDVDAAVKFLQDYEEKKKKSESIFHPLAPEPTTEEKQAANYYKSILGQTETTSVTRGIENEPRTVEEFEQTVARLKTIDMTQAKSYYNKYAGKF